MSETGSTRQEYPPGSDEARAHGCTCPVLDNGHGHGAGMLDGETVWWIRADCPLHGDAEYRRNSTRQD